MKIGVIVGSIRKGRKGDSVGAWVVEQARTRGAELPDAKSSFEYELVDLADFGLGLMDQEVIPGMANRQYDNDAATAWSQKIDEFDGFVFVTAEYNHSIPGTFKNAFDWLTPEWGGKSVAFVSYGADGGVRAVEHFRTVVANAMMQAVRGQVSLNLFTEFDGNTLAPADRRAGELATALDQLEALTATLRG